MPPFHRLGAGVYAADRTLPCRSHDRLLTLDLLLGPASGLESPLGEVAVHPHVLDEVHHPVLLEVL